MADYYTNFSLVIKLANENEQEYALDLASAIPNIGPSIRPTGSRLSVCKNGRNLFA